MRRIHSVRAAQPIKPLSEEAAGHMVNVWEKQADAHNARKWGLGIASGLLITGAAYVAVAGAAALGLGMGAVAAVCVIGAVRSHINEGKKTEDARGFEELHTRKYGYDMKAAKALSKAKAEMYSEADKAGKNPMIALAGAIITFVVGTVLAVAMFPAIAGVAVYAAAFGISALGLVLLLYGLGSLFNTPSRKVVYLNAESLSGTNRKNRNNDP